MAVARRSANLNVMAEAAQKAGRALVRDFGEVEHLQISKKGPGDFVSAADHKSEKLIKSVLEKARPTYSFLMEESGESKGSDASFRWIVDPLDGTTNFLHGTPHWCVTIALEKDKEIIAAVTYDPVKDEMFTAEKGTGAFMNNRRLRVTERNVMADCLIALDMYRPDKTFLEAHNKISPLTTLRRMGSAALDMAYVAAGRFDACAMLNLNPWDCAAGVLLIKEAGGTVTDFAGGKDYVYGKSVMGANGSLHADLLKRIGTKATIKSAS